MRTPSQATDPATLRRHFGDADDLLALWVAEPYVELAPAIRSALVERASMGWYGYETRPESVREAFWSWMKHRHGWSEDGVYTSVSPSVGTSIAVLLDLLTGRGDGVILQPPVYTGFKPLVTKAGLTVVKNPLRLTSEGYRLDLEGLDEVAANATTRALILCNPHNPVGRVWTLEELTEVARICAEHDVFVISDEIHADLCLASTRFTPFAKAALGTKVSWAATHGPIKTFGLAGLCDTLVLSSDEGIVEKFRSRSSQLHLNRNNAFGVVAFEVAYGSGEGWLDEFLEDVGENFSRLRSGLPEGVRLIEPEGTYLAWLDFRDLGMDVPELSSWLASSAKLATSPGHWFGREGAGFARMTVAVPSARLIEAISRLSQAVALL